MGVSSVVGLEQSIARRRPRAVQYGPAGVIALIEVIKIRPDFASIVSASSYVYASTVMPVRGAVFRRSGNILVIIKNIGEPKLYFTPSLRWIFVMLPARCDTSN